MGILEDWTGNRTNSEFEERSIKLYKIKQAGKKKTMKEKQNKAFKSCGTIQKGPHAYNWGPWMRRENKAEEMFKEIKAEIFQKLMKKNKSQMQVAHRILSRINDIYIHTYMHTYITPT